MLYSPTSISTFQSLRSNAISGNAISGGILPLSQTNTNDVQPWKAAEPSAAHQLLNLCKQWHSAMDDSGTSAVHLLFNSMQNTGSQPGKTAEPPAVHQHINSMHNTGSQPWMTVEPLPCTYNPIQCKHWQSALDDSGTSAVHHAHQWFVRSCTMPMWH